MNKGSLNSTEVRKERGEATRLRLGRRGAKRLKRFDEGA